jgi:hypothetical protein
MRWLLPTRLRLPTVTAPAKNVHGRSPQYKKMKKGRPSVGPPMRLKTTASTSIIPSGWMMAHKAPIAVCL